MDFYIEQPLAYGSLYRFLPEFCHNFIEMYNSMLPYTDKFGRALFKMTEIWKNPKCRELIVHFRKIFRQRALVPKHEHYVDDAVFGRTRGKSCYGDLFVSG